MTILGITTRSRAEARVLKRIEMSDHWACRRLAPTALSVLAICWSAGSIYYFWFAWKLGSGLYSKADPETIVRSLFTATFCLLLLLNTWMILFVLRERRTILYILRRLARSATEGSNS